MLFGQFDENGFLIYTFRGDGRFLTAQANVVPLPEGATANDVFMVDGKVVTREHVDIATDRTIAAADGQDAITVTGLPKRCWLMVNGHGQQVKGGKARLVLDAPDFVDVQLTGAHCSNTITVRFDTREALAQQVRAERDARLAACDWTMMPDAAVDEERKAAWISYRNELRDLPAEQPDATIETVIWPEKPQ